MKGMRANPARHGQHGQLGVTLIELMVAVTIGLIVVAALTAAFVNSSNTRRELDRVAGVLENGRYAMSVLDTELAQAGNYGSLATPSGVFDQPCSTAVAHWGTSLDVHVHGSNQDDASGAFSCLTRKSDTDAIFIQRASSCVSGPTAASGCGAMVANAAYIQVSECGDEYQTTPFVLAANAGTLATTYPLKSIVLPTSVGATPTCTVTAGTAAIRRFYRSFYYVDANNVLWRMDVDAGSTATPPGTPFQIAGGIENLQFEYGLDSNGDGAPDSFTSTPAAADWPSVVGARISLLARSESATPGYQDDKTYILGDVCSVPPTASSCPAPYSANTALVRTSADQAFKRHVFSSYVTFINPAGRRQQ